MKHIHHIIPRHAGGTDDPENLIELTVEEHAEAHRLLYEQHGRHEDWLAWKALSKQVGQEEIFLEKSRLGGQKTKVFQKVMSTKLRLVKQLQQVQDILRH